MIIKISGLFSQEKAKGT